MYQQEHEDHEIQLVEKKYNHKFRQLEKRELQSTLNLEELQKRILKILLTVKKP